MQTNRLPSIPAGTPWRRLAKENSRIEDHGILSSILHFRSSLLKGGLLMFNLIVALCLHILVVGADQALAVEATTLEQLVAGAKKEGEVTLLASASTFGGKKGFAELEAAFNKRYALTSKVNLAPGPSFPQVAARIMSELKAGAKSSTDLYLGSDGTMSDMHREKALQKINWSGVFPWVSKEMETFPQETLLIYASFHGIIYNSNAIPKDKAPKGYEDLVDPALSPLWHG